MLTATVIIIEYYCLHDTASISTLKPEVLFWKVTLVCITALTFCRGWLGAETTTVLQMANAMKKSMMYKVSGAGFGIVSSSFVKS